MRILVILLALGACDAAAPPAGAPVGVAVACAVGGATTFAPNCRVRRETRNGRALLTLVAPDGSFRRLEARGDGAGIDTADGAAHARTISTGSGAASPGAASSGEIAIAVDGDRYRLPAAAR